jgi:DNA repair protein RadC
MRQLSFYASPPRTGSLPLRERPAYRVAESPDACNTVELLAALVGGPRQIEIAEALLAKFKSLRGIRQATAAEIAGVHGIGEKTAARLVSALELGRRLALDSPDERPTIHSPADAANLIQYGMGLLEQEELWVLLLDTRNRLMDIDKLYRGSVNCAQVRCSEVFKSAVRRNAVAIIVAHNHPSGVAQPSPEDVALTRALVQSGKLLDIEVIDHLIIGTHWVSLKERGLGFG